MIYPLKELSVIIIGKNEGKNIASVLEGLQSSLEKFGDIKTEIIFVDSMSTDNSISILKNQNIKIIEIVKGFTSASLGRYLGQKHAQFQNLLFLDGDMVLESSFLKEIESYFNEHGAVTAQVDNVSTYDIDTITSVNIFNLNIIGPIKRIGGFLLISKSISGNALFRPILKDEEEIDFYGQFYGNHEIYGIPIKGVKHIDDKQSFLDKIKYHFSTQNHFGWIMGLWFAFIEKNGNYTKLIWPYLVNVLGTFSFYGMFMFKSLMWIWIFLLPFGWSIKSSIVTTILMPFRVVSAIYYYFKSDFHTTYKVDNHKRTINLKEIG